MTTKVGLGRDKRNKAWPWVVRWFGEYDPVKEKHRHYSKGFATKREAERFRAAKHAELDRGGLRDRPADIGVGEFVERYFESKVQRRCAGTRYKYRLTLMLP